MVKYVLKFSAELHGVTNLKPLDSEEEPFEYKFEIECTRCRTIHDKPVEINCYDEAEFNGQTSNFLYKCKECSSVHRASISRTKQVLTPDQLDSVPMLEIDARGMDFRKFFLDGPFICDAVDSNEVFQGIDFDDGEWYDYDEKAGQEVSVTDFLWELTR